MDNDVYPNRLVSFKKYVDLIEEGIMAYYDAAVAMRDYDAMCKAIDLVSRLVELTRRA